MEAKISRRGFFEENVFARFESKLVSAGLCLLSTHSFTLVIDYTRERSSKKGWKNFRKMS